MALSPNGPVGAYSYTNDDGDNFFIMLSLEVAQAGGFTPAGGGVGPFGTRNGKQKVRGCYGQFQNETGIHRAFCPAPTQGILSSLWNTGSFEIGGITYDITGRRGERVSRVKIGV